MPCCHIPTPANPIFPQNLIYDAEQFSQYVGGKPLANIGNPAPTTVLTSALHLEMKLWTPIKFKYPANDARGNSWKVMRVVMGRSPFTQQEKNIIFEGLNPLRLASNCCLCEYDSWFLKKITCLRNLGLMPYRAPDVPPAAHPSALATFGRCQKLVNIYVKYEICWQIVGQWSAARLVHYPPLLMPHLASFLCALHAPIDSIILREIYATTLGRRLCEKKVLVRYRGLVKLVQTSNGDQRTWSQLDCLRTYYGFQLILRRVAMHTWPKGCACDGTADAAISRCAKWFESIFGKEHPCGDDQADWLQLALELPLDVVEETIRELRSDKQSKTTVKKSGVAEPEDEIDPVKEPTKALNGQNNKTIIFIQQGPAAYLKIVDECGGRNIGMICIHANPHIWLKNLMPNLRYLIGEIHARNGDFIAEPNYFPVANGVPNCGVGGTNYQGAVQFGSIGAAIHYLKQYFSVQACAGNDIYNQAWINAQ